MIQGGGGQVSSLYNHRCYQNSTDLYLYFQIVQESEERLSETEVEEIIAIVSNILPPIEEA